MVKKRDFEKNRFKKKESLWRLVNQLVMYRTCLCHLKMSLEQRIVISRRNRVYSFCGVAFLMHFQWRNNPFDLLCQFEFSQTFYCCTKQCYCQTNQPISKQWDLTHLSRHVEKTFWPQDKNTTYYPNKIKLTTKKQELF